MTGDDEKTDGQCAQSVQLPKKYAGRGVIGLEINPKKRYP
jgi:hypothetical protein